MFLALLLAFSLDRAVVNLDSPSFHQREAASKLLDAASFHAVPILLASRRSSSPEVVHRVENLLAKRNLDLSVLRSRFPYWEACAFYDRGFHVTAEFVDRISESEPLQTAIINVGLFNGLILRNDYFRYALSSPAYHDEGPGGALTGTILSILRHRVFNIKSPEDHSEWKPKEK